MLHRPIRDSNPFIPVFLNYRDQSRNYFSSSFFHFCFIWDFWNAFKGLTFSAYLKRKKKTLTSFPPTSIQIRHNYESHTWRQHHFYVVPYGTVFISAQPMTVPLLKYYWLCAIKSEWTFGDYLDTFSPWWSVSNLQVFRQGTHSHYSWVHPTCCSQPFLLSPSTFPQIRARSSLNVFEAEYFDPGFLCLLVRALGWFDYPVVCFLGCPQNSQECFHYQRSNESVLFFCYFFRIHLLLPGNSMAYVILIFVNKDRSWHLKIFPKDFVTALSTTKSLYSDPIQGQTQGV